MKNGKGNNKEGKGEGKVEESGQEYAEFRFFSHDIRRNIQGTSPAVRLAVNHGLRVCDCDQVDYRGVDQDFASMFEINSNPIPNDGLNLADAPIRPVWMADAYAWHDMVHFRGFPWVLGL